MMEESEREQGPWSLFHGKRAGTPRLPRRAGDRVLVEFGAADRHLAFSQRTKWTLSLCVRLHDGSPLSVAPLPLPSVVDYPNHAVAPPSRHYLFHGQVSLLQWLNRPPLDWLLGRGNNEFSVLLGSRSARAAAHLRYWGQEYLSLPRPAPPRESVEAGLSIPKRVVRCLLCCSRLRATLTPTNTRSCTRAISDHGRLGPSSTRCFDSSLVVGASQFRLRSGSTDHRATEE